MSTCRNMTCLNIKGAIFDMDGTLTDSMYIWDIAGNLYLESCGVTAPSDLRDHLRALSLAQGAAYLKETYLPASSPEEIINGINAIVRKEYETRVPLKEGVREFLEKLSRRGVPMVIATATDHTIADQVLTRLGVRSYFQKIFSCPDYHTAKDEPLIFDLALDFLGTKKEETVIFEDALHAITTAKLAGYTVFAVADASEKVNESEIKRLCDSYFQTLKECEL